MPSSTTPTSGPTQIPSSPTPTPTPTPTSTAAGTGATAIYASEQGSENLFVYAADANGAAVPTAELAFPQNDPNNLVPRLSTIDSSGNYWATANLFSNQTFVSAYVARYAANPTSNSSPNEMITGVPSSDGALEPLAVAVDTAGYIYVLGGATDSSEGIYGEVYVFAPGASGTAPVQRFIAGASTGITQPSGLAVGADGSIYVSNQCETANGCGSIVVFAPGAAGNVAPARTITGSSTGLLEPTGLAFDTAGNLYVANTYAIGNLLSGQVVVFGSGANGNVVPTRLISGSATMLQVVYGIAVDTAGTIYVADDNLDVFAAGANGNIAPSHHIINPGNLPASSQGFFGVAVH